MNPDMAREYDLMVAGYFSLWDDLEILGSRIDALLMDAGATPDAVYGLASYRQRAYPTTAALASSKLGLGDTNAG